MKFRVPVEVPPQIIIFHIILGSRCQWCERISTLEEGDETHLLKGFSLKERGKEQAYIVTPFCIQKAIKSMYTKFPEQFASMISEAGNWQAASMFLQLCAFGRIVYQGGSDDES